MHHLIERRVLSIGLSFAAIVVMGFLLAGIYFASHSHVSSDTFSEESSLSMQSESTHNTIASKLLKLPMIFEKNMGQSDASVKFLTRGPGRTFYFTPNDIVMVLSNRQRNSDNFSFSSVKLHFVGAQLNPSLIGLNEQPSKSHYFIGESSEWHTDIPHYSKVFYQDVYPGIDAVFYGNEGRLEYDLIVAPDHDPQNIRFHVQGAEKLYLDENGNLHIALNDEQELQMLKPYVFQMQGETKVQIEGSFLILAKNDIGFLLGDYDKKQLLIIDPILAYSTYLGGNGNDSALGNAVDASGNAYACGNTTSTNFPTTSGAFQTTAPSGENVFITKINPTGTALIYSTYLGGSGTDIGADIAIDSNNNAFVTGETSSANFPTTAGAFKTTLTGPLDAFVTKLDPTGSTLVYSTYLGGSSADSGSSITVDINGNAYVVGTTNSANFPTTISAFQTALAGSQDGFVTKMNLAGTGVDYSTYLGGSGLDTANSIAIDSSGDAFVTGVTKSSNFPTTVGAFQTAFAGTQDAFVTKLNSNGTALLYSTYLGGSATDAGNEIAIDSSGSAYVTGDTQSINFPTTTGVFQPSFQGTQDAFVTKFDSTGALVYSTYLGGGGTDTGFSIIIDSNDNAYVTGSTQSSNFPTTTGAIQSTYNGVGNAFITKLNSAGSQVLYSTYFGGSALTSSLSIVLDSSESQYICGTTSSTDFPTTANAFQQTIAVAPDAFLAKLEINPIVTSISPNCGPATGGIVVTITGSGFANATSVLFGATLAVFVIDNDSQITAVSPAGAGTVDIKVVTPFGTSAISAADQFTYFAPPVVTNVNPSQGPTSGGTAVTITGVNFTGVTNVFFGAAPAAFTFISDTQINATSPPGTGTVDVKVATTCGGTSAISVADQFTYIPAPTITGITPSSGCQTGGTVVTITGTNFTGATAVFFGATAATTFVVDNDAQITATAPPGTGSVDITVVTPSGVSPITAADQFTYIPAPTVTNINPSQGPPTGGTVVTITGTNFTGATAVHFGASSATFIVNSDTQITVTSPPGAGTVDITVTTSCGTSAMTVADRFTYSSSALAPIVTSLNPSTGCESGGTVVIITGTHFTGATAVHFGTASASFVVNSDTQITATAPSGTGTVDVTVTTPNGTSAITTADQFTYLTTSTTTLVVSPNPSVFLQQVTLTATVSPSSATGTVTFFDGTNMIGTIPLVNGKASIRTSSLSGGVHALSATYSGNNVLCPSVSSVVNLTVITALPPVDLKVVQRNNKFATQEDIVNILTWKAPKGGTPIVAFRIYRNRNLTKLIAEVSNTGRLRYADHNRKKGKTYTYFVVSVDRFGNTSAPAEVTIRDR